MEGNTQGLEPCHELSLAQQRTQREFAHTTLPSQVIMSPSTFVAMRPGHGVHFGIDPATAAVFCCPKAHLPKVTVALQRATSPMSTTNLIGGLVHAGLEQELALLLVQDLLAYGILQPPPQRHLAIIGRGSLAAALIEYLRPVFPLTTLPPATSNLQFLHSLGPEYTIVMAGAISPVLRQALRLRKEVWPVDIRDGWGVIGPVVRGGQGACATCVDLYHAAGQPHWQIVDAQRPIRPRRNPLPELAVAAKLGALLSPEVPAPGVRNEPIAPSTVIELSPFEQQERRRIQEPHPHCPVCFEGGTARALRSRRQLPQLGKEPLPNPQAPPR